jgi:23S rRNA pseudouridine2605 synthase
LKAGEVEEVKRRVLADQLGWSTKPKVLPRKAKTSTRNK